MNKKLSLALVLLVMTMGAAMLTTIMSVKPVLAIVVFCHNCGASSLSPGTEAKSPGDAKNVAPGQEAQFPVPFCNGCAKDFSPGQEGLNAGIIGPELKK